MGRVYTHFQTKRVDNQTIGAAHTHMAYMREYPPGCTSSIYFRLDWGDEAFSQECSLLGSSVYYKKEY